MVYIYPWYHPSIWSQILHVGTTLKIQVRTSRFESDLKWTGWNNKNWLSFEKGLSSAIVDHQLIDGQLKWAFSHFKIPENTRSVLLSERLFSDTAHFWSNGFELTWGAVDSWSRFWPLSWLWANFWQCHLKLSHCLSQSIRCRLLTWVKVGVVPVILPRNSFRGNICLSGSISNVFHIFGCRFSSWRKTPNAELL